MSRAKRQKPERTGRQCQALGEALRQHGRDEAHDPRLEHPATGLVQELASTGGLLEQALTRHNLQAAWKRVKANRGAAGADGLDIEQTGCMLRAQWPSIRQALLAGQYRPWPVRKVMIPKADGSQRELGIPTVLDRLIQQALLQVLQSLIDPSFSEHSHGFRPGRSAHDALKAAHAHVKAGKQVVVDVDLEKFFDRVNHDILIDRLSKRIRQQLGKELGVGDMRVLALIRAYLNAGIMSEGVHIQRHMGTPQGGPLSPLLANILLDEVDKALEARGHSFVRYADDCNVYVRSLKAGHRVMAYLRASYGRLKLRINEAKSAVASALGRKFLGYALWVDRAQEVRCAVAQKAQHHFKAKIRRITARSSGKSLGQVVEQLRRYMLGWRAYFALANTPKVWSALDAWVRRRLRAMQLKQWKSPKTAYRKLLALGATQDEARQVAAHCQRWWRCSQGVLRRVLNNAYFDKAGVPRLC